MKSYTTNTAAEALRGGRRLWYSSHPHPLSENRPTSVNTNRKAHKPPTLQQKRGKKIKKEKKKKEPRHAHTQPLDSLRGLAAPKIIARCPQSSVDSEEEGLWGGWETSKVNKGGLHGASPVRRPLWVERRRWWAWRRNDAQIAGATVDLHAYISLLWSNKGVRFTASSAHIYATGAEVSCT